MPLANCSFFHFGLIVTGKGEEEFLPYLFKGVAQTRICAFRVIARIGQRSPRTSSKTKIKITGTNKNITDKDFDEIGVPARKFIMNKSCFYVMLVDDVEYDRIPILKDVFKRYREALDKSLEENAQRASVHFLCTMLEAYYFADCNAVKGVLGINLPPCQTDPENIRHPKNELKQLFQGFDERGHGRQIIQRLDMNTVLGDTRHCSFLRAAYAWCYKAIGQQAGGRFQLDSGAMAILTGRQIADL